MACQCDVFALYLCTKNDTSGNPRRGWVVFRSGIPSAFVKEGYRGASALSDYLGESPNEVAGSWYAVYVTPTEFKKWVNKCRDWDGVEVINN